MQVLQRIDQRELRPQIQLQGGMADGSEIHQHHAPVSLLQGDGGIHRGGGGAGSALGVQKSEDAGLAGTALRAAQRGREASEGFDQGFAAGGMIQKLARAGSHGGNNVRGLVHFAHGKNRDIGNAGVDQFDGANGSLRILRIDIHQDDFGVLILQLTQNRVARSRRETDMAQYRSGQIGALHPAVQVRRIVRGPR